MIVGRFGSKGEEEMSFRKFVAVVLVLAVVAFISSAQALAQCDMGQKLVASDASGNDQFGHAISISGNVAMVGAFNQDGCLGSNCGAVYVYNFDGNNWLEVQTLKALDAASGDSFGRSVSVDGDRAVIGARLDDCTAGIIDCGSAYVFQFNGTTWEQEQKLTASDAESGDFFGASISMSGDTIVVGARAKDCMAVANCGAAYVFRFNGTTWIEEQKLTAPDAAAGDEFGRSVSTTGGVTVVSSFNDDCVGPGTNCGSAYVYRFNGAMWSLDQKLIASDAADGDGFGQSVSMGGDAIVVGAILRNCNAGGGRCGAAYVFNFNGVNWMQQQILTPADAIGGDKFGHAVSLSGNAMVIGAFESDCGADIDCGSAYVFRFNGANWVEQQKLFASDAASMDKFGFSVSISGDAVVVGARLADCGAIANCGSAYAFRCLNNIAPVPTLSAWGGVTMVLLTLTVGSLLWSKRRAAIM